MFSGRVWDEAKDYSSRGLDQGGLGVDQSREKTFFELDEKALVRVILDQIKFAEVMKRKAESGKLKLPLKGVCIVLDDVLDNLRFRRYSPMIDLLASRARHAFISFSPARNIFGPSVWSVGPLLARSTSFGCARPSHHLMKKLRESR